ncbi:CpsD/CapB family tyrosine-protein kinase [Halanaerocella petrolearia]
MTRINVGEEKEKLIVEYNPKLPASESYRELRTNISYLSPDEPLNKIAITSSVPSEGKSLTVANLAISIAHNNQKVIIIDADLRKPSQHKFYGLPNYEGLSNILTGELSFIEGLQETQIDGLSLISTGFVPPNPAELLSSYKMEEVINAAEEKADFVIVDTPPVIAVTDATIVARRIDGILLVVASYETEREMLVESKEKLEKANANIIGTILNKDPVDKGSSYNYKYYGIDEKV